MSTTQTMPARQRAAGHLSTKPTLALTRWFLATRTAVSEPVHEVLIKELDVSPPGIVIAFF